MLAFHWILFWCEGKCKPIVEEILSIDFFPNKIRFAQFESGLAFWGQSEMSQEPGPERKKVIRYIHDVVVAIRPHFCALGSSGRVQGPNALGTRHAQPLGSETQAPTYTPRHVR